jgi:uncharacterized Zn-finger protein
MRGRRDNLRARFFKARLMAKTTSSQQKLIPANAKNSYEVSAADLPLSCPMPGMQLWNSHPRVMLAIEASGTEKCPYCGAVYVLKAA